MRWRGRSASLPQVSWFDSLIEMTLLGSDTSTLAVRFGCVCFRAETIYVRGGGWGIELGKPGFAEA